MPRERIAGDGVRSSCCGSQGTTRSWVTAALDDWRMGQQVVAARGTRSTHTRAAGGGRDTIAAVFTALEPRARP